MTTTHADILPTVSPKEPDAALLALAARVVELANWSIEADVELRDLEPGDPHKRSACHRSWRVWQQASAAANRLARTPADTDEEIAAKRAAARVLLLSDEFDEPAIRLLQSARRDQHAVCDPIF